jgi:hypothetical protein
MTEENGHWYYIISDARGTSWWKMIYTTSPEAAIAIVRNDFPEAPSDLTARKFDL